MDGRDKIHELSLEKLEKLRRTSSIASSGASTLVVGSTDLYEDGQIRLIPAPTPDPHGEIGKFISC
jgi:hypothetical protein